MNTDPQSLLGSLPGWDYLKQLAALHPLKNLTSAATPTAAQWVAPTFNEKEIDQRIQEFKAVLFWLEQNSSALKATIQALEVQKMTLGALKNMNVNFQDLAKTFAMPTPASSAASDSAASPAASAFSNLMPQREAAAQAPTPAPAPAPSSRKAPSKGASPKRESTTATQADPMQWWGALTEQFQSIAQNAMKDLAQQQPSKAQSPQSKGKRSTPKASSRTPSRSSRAQRS